MSIAKEAYEEKRIKSIGFSTHITSQASIKLMIDRGFNVVSQQLLVTKDYEFAESLNEHDFVITPWIVNEVELAQCPALIENKDIFNFAFTYQKVTAGLVKELNDKKIPLCINGHKGFYQVKGEPNILSVDGSYEGLNIFMQYALYMNRTLNNPEPITYVSAENKTLIKRLEDSDYRSLNHWESDYFHFEFQ